MNETFKYDIYNANRDLKYTVQSFREKYSKIRVYHAARPIEIESYLVNGIRPISDKQSLEIFMKLSLKIPQERLNDEFYNAWNEQDNSQKKVWVSLTKEELLKDSGHYLVYGSEFVLGIAVKLGVKDKLKLIGIPTIFSCDVRIDKISNYFFESVIEAINENSTSDIAFSIEGKIDHDEIVLYENPIKIFDPIEWKYYYYSRNKSDKK